jgi:F-type H+-transporting ATPase subunit delta
MTLSFLSVTIDHNRGKLLPEIIERYKQLFRALRGYQTVTVVVAKALGPDQAAKLRQDLAGAMHAKVDLDVHVDPAILGGVILRYADKMLDNSIRGRLIRTVAQVTNPENRYKR